MRLSFHPFILRAQRISAYSLVCGRSQYSTMACVTLKRPVDVLGSPHMDQQPLTKRKRCGPLLFPSTPSPSASPSRGLKRVKRMLEMDDQPLSPMSGSARAVSQFLSATPPLQTGDNTRLRVSLCQSVSVLVSYFRSVV